jgi:hypothetical protein
LRIAVLVRILYRRRLKKLERQEAEAFARLPMPLDEVLVWQAVQDWDDEGKLFAPETRPGG